MKRVEDILYVVMPAYNEEENITDVIKTWAKVLDGKSEKSRLVVADSGSSDKTHDILLSLQKKFKNLEILSDTGKLHGPKVIALYKYAIKEGANYIFQTDSDGQTNPDEFASFWDNRNAYDGILGYRKKRGDGKMRSMVEKVVCLLLRLFFGVRVPDANAPYRLMKSSLVKKYINKIPSDYDLPNIVLTAYFARFNEHIMFKEVSFKPRIAGVNSIDLKKIFRIGKESLSAFWYFRKNMKKDAPEEFRKDKKQKIGFLAIILGFIIISCVIIINNPSFPWGDGSSGSDTNVFLTVGRQMENGMMPYKDTFDHKGPLMYLINFWGVIINESKGIFIFEFLAIFFTLYFMYKIARLKLTSQSASFVLTLISFTPFLLFYQTDFGNLTEEYAMPFITCALYIFLKYFLTDNITKLGLFAVGLSFACVLMLRVNMVAIWVIFCLMVVIKNIKNKTFKDLRNYTFFFMVGVLSVLAPITCWLIFNGAFNDFWNIYIVFNFSYSKTDLEPIISTMIYFINSSIIFCGLVLTIYFAFKGNEVKEKRLFKLYLATFFIALLTACMSGRLYPHYGMVLTPLAIFPLTILCQKTNQIDITGIGKLAILLFLTSLVFNVWLGFLKNSIDVYYKRNEIKNGPEDTAQICKYIDENTTVSDKITVYGNWNNVYIKCNRLPASKYSYQFPISDINPSILDEFFGEISLKRPKIFVLEHSYTNQRVLDFLNENGYIEKPLVNTPNQLFLLK